MCIACYGDRVESLRGVDTAATMQETESDTIQDAVPAVAEIVLRMVGDSKEFPHDCRYNACHIWW